MAAAARLAAVTAVNNTYIGLLYIGTALLFLVLAGILALLMRAQLAVPGNTLLGPQAYNQVFTMHGTVMMFLFAVPIVEAIAVYLLPNMLGARDLPFPRLSAYAFWAYAFGGLAFFCSLFFGLAPDGGWFMYPPLTGNVHSPGMNADFWLLGIGFIEISAIAGAIELIIGILMTRPPGMTLGRMPVYAWAMLVVGFMIVFAFPAVIACTALLEMERAFDWPFFDAQRGGDPLLWQHLFWFFGHPDVYIIFLPAAGMVSVMLPALAGTPLVGHRAVIAALAATGFFSFALWAHHMFTAGLGSLSLSFVSAASMAVSIPAGIQVFAWIATLWRGQVRWNTPTLFIVGFLVTFVMGGLTGVMVAALPFDWQAHDSYFVVAHLHYVLIGGMVMPVLAGALLLDAAGARASRCPSAAADGCSASIFVGFHVTFFPMHLPACAACRGASTPTTPGSVGTGATWCQRRLGADRARHRPDDRSTSCARSDARRASGQPVERADTRVASDGRLRHAQHSAGRGARTAVAAAAAGEGSAGRTALAAGHRDRRARDAGHDAVAGRSAPRHRAADAELAADRRRVRHGGVLHPADGEAGGAGVRLRRARRRLHRRLAVADRPAAGRRQGGRPARRSADGVRCPSRAAARLRIHGGRRSCCSWSTSPCWHRWPSATRTWPCCSTYVHRRAPHCRRSRRDAGGGRLRARRRAARAGRAPPVGRARWAERICCR